MIDARAVARYRTRCLHTLRPVCTLSPQRTKTRTARMKTARMRTASRNATTMMMTVPAGNVRPVTGIWLLLSSAQGGSVTLNARVVSQGVQRLRLTPTTPGHRLVRTPFTRSLASALSHSLKSELCTGPDRHLPKRQRIAPKPFVAGPAKQGVLGDA